MDRKALCRQVFDIFEQPHTRSQLRAPDNPDVPTELFYLLLGSQSGTHLSVRELAKTCGVTYHRARKLFRRINRRGEQISKDEFTAFVLQLPARAQLDLRDRVLSTRPQPRPVPTPKPSSKPTAGQATWAHVRCVVL